MKNYYESIKEIGFNQKSINIYKRLQILQPLLAPVTPYSHKNFFVYAKKKELLVGQEKLQSVQTW